MSHKRNSCENANNSTHMEIAWVESYNYNEKWGYFRSIKNRKVYFHREILKTRKIREEFIFKQDKINKNSIFKISVIKDPRGFKADKIEYVGNRIPNDTRRVIDNEFSDCNFSLRLNKVPDFFEDKFILVREIKNNNKKKAGIKLVVEPNFSHDLIQNIICRQELAIRNMNIISNINNPLILSSDWRMVVGLGNETIYNTSMTLHHLYGIPYIPGQAIKGVVRSWVITELFNGVEEEALKDKGFRLIFGGPSEGKFGEHKGSVIFFDAFPTSVPLIEPDIMNPHYFPYYSDNQLPADYHTPNPIFFLTVTKTRFQFIVGIKESENKVITEEGIERGFMGKTPLTIVETWLKKTLTEHGIGAKTAVGYGYMKE